MGKILKSINANILQARKDRNAEKQLAYQNGKAELMKFCTSVEGSKKCTLNEDGSRNIPDNIEVDIIKKYVKDLYATADLYRTNNRADLAEKNEAEASYLEIYLPKEATKEDIHNCINLYMAENKLEKLEQKLMGAVMKFIKETLENVDGKVASEIIRTYF